MAASRPGATRSPRLIQAGSVSNSRLRIPADQLPDRSPLQLLASARADLDDAAEQARPGQRYAEAHMAALRVAAAVLAVRAGDVAMSRRRPGRPSSTWELLRGAAPELEEWASHFARTARKRVLAQAGIPDIVTGEEADAIVADSRRFLDVVVRLLGFDAVAR
ncbi:SAV_6107 family HEPN domain-containing protein [Glycomyces xiaoerkulensis]|uniref:SAV_6107 family HEPN domain-containing protein n=1 Tax=Glycomyces xiaoerkulensis TaxID=2038139 RepID=UPI0012FFF478|nr:SAV_6107 family HEPN domain-containing protein [Glycomyces xiaoerkulensis]